MTERSFPRFDPAGTWCPAFNQGSVAYFRAKEWLRKNNEESRRFAYLLIDRLRERLGDAIVERFEARVAEARRAGADHRDALLERYRLPIRVHFDSTVRGVLSWEDVEALLCEGKDCVLTIQRVRTREFKTAVHEAASLAHLPLTVAHDNQRALVEVDMSPARWFGGSSDVHNEILASVKAALTRLRDGQ